MSSRHVNDASTGSFQRQTSRSDTQNTHKSIISKPDYSTDEDQSLLKYWNKNQNELEKRYGSYLLGKQNTKKRIARYYSINNNSTLLIVLQGDITRTKVDAIVNAANEHMTGGAGVDGMIHRVAGEELYRACVAHKEVECGVRLPTGHSRILLSYKMSSTTHYIINTAGPVYDRRAANECAKQLSSCYKTALDLANLYDLESIGFTAISCGIFGYPADDGARVALTTIDQHAGSLPVVVFVLWDDHIYDAWVKMVEELKFVLFDPESFTPKTPTEDTKDNKDEKPSTDQSNSSDIEAKSTSTFNKNVQDFSTQETTEKESKDEIAALLETSPSIPNDSSDSQQTQVLDSDENSMDVEQKLHPQTTIEMDNRNSQEEGEGETKEIVNETREMNTTNNNDGDGEEHKQRAGSGEN